MTQITKKTKASGRGKTKTDDLTIKHRVFLDNILTGMGTINAAKAAGFRATYAYQLRRNLAKKKKFAEILELAGLDDGTIAIHLAQLFGANTWKYNPADFKFEAFPDNTARVAVLRMAMEAKAILKPDQGIGDGLGESMTSEEAMCFVLGEKELPD